MGLRKQARKSLKNKLGSKLDDLRARVKFQRDIRDCNLLCFTETWLSPVVLDHAIQLAEFSVHRMGRTLESGKSRGGGVCLIVNSSWCNSASIVPLTCSCTPNLELLTIKCRPFYLPQEFTSVIISAVYIPPQVDTDTALYELHEALTQHQTQHRDSALIVAGDFNSANLKHAAPNFYQHRTFISTSAHERTLDHCYTTKKDSYKAQSRPPFGKSDHAAIFLIPKYKQWLKQEVPAQREFTRWTDQSVAALQDALDDADWDMFWRSSDDINVFTEAVVGFIGNLADDTVQKTIIRTFPNQKPWVDKTIRDALRSHTAAYNGLRTITDYKAPTSGMPNVDASLADELNMFYTRFEAAAIDANAKANANVIANAKANASGCREEENANTKNAFIISEHDVRRAFRRVNTRKVTGPDGISGRVLRACADQLAPVFTEIFNLSLIQSGCVLSPLLYSLYTYDSMATTNIKFADDTVVVGLISDNNEMAYLEEIRNLESRCQRSNLLLNISKTKELIVDFRTKQERN
ncbi:hypothetical protein QTP86_026082 [Hemibagrus guttatus]|nr:hypothetical protein QTP86_026082 [Hemibagrus guttatus]